MQKLKQAAFFHLMGKKMANGKNLVPVVMELLQLTKNQAYRRINAQTALSFEDIAMLAKHFQISLDDLLLENKDSIGFQFGPIHQPSFSYETYLKQLDHELKQAQQLPRCKLLYATNEFPIFYTFLSPQLVQFKLYMWERTFWEKPANANKLFSLEKLEEESFLYVAFDNPNFIKTDNQKLCHYTQLWFDKLRKKSLLLSNSAERTRKHFFMDLKKEVTQLEDRVKKLL